MEGTEKVKDAVAVCEGDLVWLEMIFFQSISIMAACQQPFP
jgi:hypothetical protein